MSSFSFCGVHRCSSVVSFIIFKKTINAHQPRNPSITINQFVLKEAFMTAADPQTPSSGANYEHDPLSEAIIKCVFTVANTLGAGFLEKVYENALAHEIRKAGLKVEQQVGITVQYEGVEVGNYVADLVVEGRLLLEIKACKALEDIHLAQCLNYLKATGIHTSLLINFGTSKPQIRRLSL